MSNDLVVKSNQVVEASYRLSIIEQRLVLSALAQIPKGCDVSDDEIYKISVDDLHTLIGVHEKTAYRDLKNAVNRLYERSIYLKGKTQKFRWVQFIDFIDDRRTVGIRFGKDILPFISNLKENFTQYLLSDVSKMQGIYSIRIYELLIQYRSIGERVITIEDLRYMLDLGSKYNTTGNLVAWVINPSLEEINKETNLIVDMEIMKTGRKFTHVKFKIEQKKKTKEVEKGNRDQHTPDLFFNMTEAQLNTFSSKLAYLPELGNLAEGNEGYPELAQRIKRMLVDPEQQKQFKPHLEKLGFKIR